LEVSAKTNNGIFLTLAECLKQPLNENLRFSLEDFIINIIELKNDYNDYFQKNSYLIAPQVDVLHDGDVKLILPSQLFLDNTKEQFWELITSRTTLLDDFEEVASEEDSIVLKLSQALPHDKIIEKGSEVMREYFSYSVFEDGNYYLNLYPTEKRMHPILGYFGCMFLLSSIVRYSPAHLDKFVHEKNTSVAWFFRKLCERSERVFPNLLLNMLCSDSFKFASSFGI
jgi:hypothetical protein